MSRLVSGHAPVPNPTPTESIHPRLRGIFESLNDSGNDWLLLRGEDDLSEPEGDVDLLLPAAGLDAFDMIARANGFRRIFAPGHGSHHFFFTFHSETGRWLKLDVVTEISFGRHQELRTPLAAGCLARRVVRGPLWLPEAADHSWLLLAHLVLDKRQIAESRRAEALAAAAQVPLDAAVPRYLDAALGVGTAVTILDAIVGDPPDQVPELAATLRARWLRRPKARARSIAVSNRLGRLLSPTTGRSGPLGRGMRVAVMGPDGAGKTTLLHGLATALPLPTKYVYLGMWAPSAWDRYVSRFPGGRILQKLVRLVRARTTTSYHLRRGRVVLLDRVPYDADLPGAQDSSIGGRITTFLIHAIAPRPDLLLLLDAPGELMYARKHEHSVAVLEVWRKAYRALAARLPNVWLLDASQSADDVLRAAVTIVWPQINGDEGSPPSRFAEPEGPVRRE